MAKAKYKQDEDQSEERESALQANNSDKLIQKQKLSI